MTNAPEPWRLDLDTLIRQVDSLPALPAVVVELIESVDDEDADADLLASKISRDQALVARMLRVANSSFYGLQGKVTSIHDAIVVLGLRGVRTLATAAAVTACFSSRGLAGSFDYRAFWAHGISVALCARAIARRLRVSEENAFTAGLLHDIGRLVLAARFPRHFDAVVEHRRREDCLLVDAEVALLGIDHARIGRALTERWHFSPLISAAIAGHHQSEQAELRSLTHLIHVADGIVHALALSGGRHDIVPPISPVSWNAVNLDREDFLEIFAEVEAQFEDVCELLIS